MFNLFTKSTALEINTAVQKAKSDKQIILVDVRETDEFKAGHIPGAINVPLSNLTAITYQQADQDRPMYIYCYSGGRSSKATKALTQAGYTNVTDIGGIMNYTGSISK